MPATESTCAFPVPRHPMLRSAGERTTVDRLRCVPRLQLASGRDAPAPGCGRGGAPEARYPHQNEIRERFTVRSPWVCTTSWSRPPVPGDSIQRCVELSKPGAATWCWGWIWSALEVPFGALLTKEITLIASLSYCGHAGQRKCAWPRRDAGSPGQRFPDALITHGFPLKPRPRRSKSPPANREVGRNKGCRRASPDRARAPSCSSACAQHARRPARVLSLTRRDHRSSGRWVDAWWYGEMRRARKGDATCVRFDVKTVRLPPVSLVLRELPDPEPGIGEIVVRIEGASVNFPGHLVRSEQCQVRFRFP